MKGYRLVRSSSMARTWPRSVCSLGSALVVCQEDRCRLLLFTSALILRSTCGRERGRDLDQFDSPWSVTTLGATSNSILVADSNNRRLQSFKIGSQGEFLFQFSLITREKPFFVTSNERYFAVSCENGQILSYSTAGNISMANVNLRRMLGERRGKKTKKIAFLICMNTENSQLYLSDPLCEENCIHQLTITGDYLRRFTWKDSFLRIHSLVFDDSTRELIITDSINSLIYAVRTDATNERILLLEQSFPHSLCFLREGRHRHLVVVECSVTGEHRVNIFSRSLLLKK